MEDSCKVPVPLGQNDKILSLNLCSFLVNMLTCHASPHLYLSAKFQALDMGLSASKPSMYLLLNIYRRQLLNHLACPCYFQLPTSLSLSFSVFPSCFHLIPDLRLSQFSSTFENRNSNWNPPRVPLYTRTLWLYYRSALQTLREQLGSVYCTRDTSINIVYRKFGPRTAVCGKSYYYYCAFIGLKHSESDD
jgi:hypothetical protein